MLRRLTAMLAALALLSSCAPAPQPQQSPAPPAAPATPPVSAPAPQADTRLYIARPTGKWGLVNGAGEVVHDFVYGYVQALPGGLFYLPQSGNLSYDIASSAEAPRAALGDAAGNLRTGFDYYSFYPLPDDYVLLQRSHPSEPMRLELWKDGDCLLGKQEFEGWPNLNMEDFAIVGGTLAIRNPETCQLHLFGLPNLNLTAPAATIENVRAILPASMAGHILVELDEKTADGAFGAALYTTGGELAVPPRDYNYIEPNGDMGYIVAQDWRWRYVGFDMQLLFDAGFAAAQPFEGGVAVVHDDEAFLIDEAGARLTQLPYDHVFRAGGRIFGVTYGDGGALYEIDPVTGAETPAHLPDTEGYTVEHVMYNAEIGLIEIALLETGAEGQIENCYLDPAALAWVIPPGAYSYAFARSGVIEAARPAYPGSQFTISDILAADGTLLATGFSQVDEIANGAVSGIRGFSYVVQTFEGRVLFSRGAFTGMGLD